MRRRLAGVVAAIAVLLGLPAVMAFPPAPAETLRPAQADPPGAVAYAVPLAGEPAVLRRFDPPDQPWLAGHRGVDLAADVGAGVRAAADGVVAFAGVVAGTPVVSIDHADGIRTTYQPVVAAVERGAVVAGGDHIGELGLDDHCGAAPCLHWGARIAATTYVDPLGLLRVPIVRLYPIE